ncbi:MAG: hypothetical protein HZC42_14885 [Candidatus Eisenbacteria bacterium]|nr:hypothetical protein [Candidatus Eisenbacteria bacterium]
MPRAGRIAACGLGLLAFAAAAGAGTLADPGCGVTGLPARPDAVTYRLPHTFVRAGSDSVWTRAGAWRRGADYLLDPLRGELRVLRQPAPGETLWVAACWLLAPPPLELQFQRYRAGAPAAPESAAAPPGAGAPAAARPVTSRTPFAAPVGAALSVSGNKTVAVEFGSSQDAFLRQSLDLAVSGTLAPGVQLTGVLSDRNLPLTAAGSTQDLQALDRVLIELTAPRGSVALGDVPLVLGQGEFARLERRVQGVRGEWSRGGFRGSVAAASAQGEYFRVQFYGVEGRQGPYLLTDRDGNTGISVVANSEVVTVDGVRMTRGEGADYALDYERGRITFTNRRPVTAATRITVDYQFALNRYRRNLALASGRWERGRLRLFTSAVTESDDRGRPLDLALDGADRLVLAAAGDSAARAIGPGVTPGAGDYDTVRVASGLVFAYAGADSGDFSVRFARVGAGLGDYADSTVFSGRTAYRYVGPGAGAFRVGRALPLPESHQLWSLGGGARLGALALELEGAASKRDLNTFSSLDDQRHVGGAGRAALSLEGGLPGPLGWGGLAPAARAVGERFAPFSRIERPFAEQDWGLPAGGGLKHARRAELTGFVRPRAGGELRAGAGRLTAPGGFSAWRRTLEWTMDRALATRARWERADATQRGARFVDGGRERLFAEARLGLRWLEPAVRAESDARRSPADSGRVGARFREGGVELASPRALAWHALAGWSLRRDARMTAGGFVDQSLVRTYRLALETPAGAGLGAVLSLQRRDLRPLADPRRSRGDLASVRLRGEDAGHGLKALANLEVTSEGENRRVRQVVFVGAGRGGYDATGNFVGTGDYDLVLVVSQDLEKIARAATSARFEWQVPGPERWRGTRAAFDFETETRRRGELLLRDPVIAPGAALGDAALARGMVLQRLEGEIAPDSRAAALRLRAERRVTADRFYQNFAQTLDDRSLSARWRTRPGSTVTTEIEGRVRRQVAVQALAGAAGFRRTLLEQAGVAQLAWTPDARLRAVAALEAAWSRPAGQPDLTRTVKLGPDLGVAFGARGRAELSLRRAFLSGPPAVGLLPSAEPAGAPRWDGTARLDYRVRESTTAALSLNLRERPGRAAVVTGRAELRAFF